MGFWDELWDTVTDWFDGDDLREVQERNPANANLESAPTPDEVRANINTLRPIMLEGFRREAAFERYGLESFRTHNDDFSTRLSESGGGYADTSQDETGKHIAGFYRMSSTLGFYMPKTPTQGDVDYFYNGDDFRERWTGSTESDDSAIDGEATDQTNTALERITEAFDEVLAQCDLPAMQTLLDTITPVFETMVDLFETHHDSEAKEVRDLWQDWDGADAEAAVETFGNNFRPAMHKHRQAAAHLVHAASCEAEAQLAAILALHNHVARVWELIQENLRPINTSSESAARFTGNFTVNRVPLLSDILIAGDFVVEVASSGSVQAPVTGFVTQLAERLGQTKEVPDAALCDELVEMLETKAGECNEALTEARDGYSSQQLAYESEEWVVGWSDAKPQYVPGYLE